MTLIAAWKSPHVENAFGEFEGIRVISDGKLTADRGTLSSEWSKIQIVEPIVRVPVSSMDEDWWESFDHWEEHHGKPIGLFFAGSSIPFRFALDRVRDVVQKLGLTAVFSEGDRSDYLRTDIVRHENADAFNRTDSIYGGHYYPPPPFGLEFVAGILADQLRAYYEGGDAGPRNLAPRSKEYGKLYEYSEIGIAGYCAESEGFRLFHLRPEDRLNDDGYVEDVPTIVVREVSVGELLLMGCNSHHDEIEVAISEETTQLEGSLDEIFLLPTARQHAVEQAINSGDIKGVGGKLTRAAVTARYGFQIVDGPWAPPEMIDADGFDNLTL